MKRVFYAFVPLNTTRPGGPWWLRDLPDAEVEGFVRAIAPAAVAVRVSDNCGVYDPDHIAPPADAVRIKGD